MSGTYGCWVGEGRGKQRKGYRTITEDRGGVRKGCYFIQGSKANFSGKMEVRKHAT